MESIFGTELLGYECDDLEKNLCMALCSAASSLQLKNPVMRHPFVHVNKPWFDKECINMKINVKNLLKQCKKIHLLKM